MIHRYRIDNTPDMSGKIRGMIGNIKTGEWCKYTDVEPLEEFTQRVCDLLVNPYDFGDHERDTITELAEEYLKG